MDPGPFRNSLRKELSFSSLKYRKGRSLVLYKMRQEHYSLKFGHCFTLAGRYQKGRDGGVPTVAQWVKKLT